MKLTINPNTNPKTFTSVPEHHFNAVLSINADVLTVELTDDEERYAAWGALVGIVKHTGVGPLYFLN